jgi:hypothetical protein
MIKKAASSVCGESPISGNPCGLTRDVADFLRSMHEHPERSRFAFAGDRATLERRSNVAPRIGVHWSEPHRKGLPVSEGIE